MTTDGTTDGTTGTAGGSARGEDRPAAPGRRTVVAGVLLSTLGTAGLVARPAWAASRRASGPTRGAAKAGPAGVTVTPLRTADGSLRLQSSFQLTRSGLVLGVGMRADGGYAPVVWSRRHGLVELFASAPQNGYRAVRINDLGTLSGYRAPGGEGPTTAMLWGPEGSRPREIGGRNTKAGHLNNHGQVLVNYDPDGDPDEVVGTLHLHSAGGDREIALPVPAGSYPWALALTDSGHVIGYTQQYNPPIVIIPDVGDIEGTRGGTSGGAPTSGGVSGSGGTSGGTSTSGGSTGGTSTSGGASGGTGQPARPQADRGLASDGGDQRAVSFHWYRGRTTDLSGILGGEEPALRTVNNSGLVIGNYYPSYGMRVFLWKDGRVSDLIPGHPFDITITGAEQALNDRGDIVGSAQPQLDEPLQPFLYTGGRLTVLPVPAGYSGHAHAVSSGGDMVAGSCMTPDGTLHACLWRGGRFFDLGVPDGCTESEGQWISDRGEVFGYASREPGDTRYAYRWTVA